MGRVAELASCECATSDKIRAEYFQWLCGLVGMDEPDHSYWTLARILHRRNFYWSVDNDGNRWEDGVRMRLIFEDETNYSDYSCLDGDCSILEMLIALAIRIADTLGTGDNGDIQWWFWRLIENLWEEDMVLLEDGELILGDYTDYLFCQKLDIWLDRRFRRSGKGGLFPLRHAKKDQRKVEIWYQMQAYLMENCRM